MRGTVRWLRFLLVTALIFGMLLPLPAVTAETEDGNLIYNGDFSVIDEDGIPEGWYTEAYIEDPGYSVFKVDPSEKRNGSNVVSIQNIALNDARFAQVVEVLPETVYRFSGDIRAEDVQEGHGANLSIEGMYLFSEKVYDTDGEWQHIEWYGETGPDQEDVTLFVRLGGYSGESMGKAWFADIRLEEVEEIPDGVIPDSWFKEEREPAVYDDEDETADEEEAGPAWPWLLCLGIAYACAVVLFVRGTRDGAALKPETTVADKLAVPLLFLFALIVRIIVSAVCKGYDVDVGCFLSWGGTMLTYGPTQFYLNTGFCDYPPAYTYVLGLCSLLSKLTGASDALTRVIFRLIPSMCDVAACWMIYRIGIKNRLESKRWIFAVTFLMALNPATILNSAAWGQMDSVLCLLLLAVALYAVNRKWEFALPLYMLSVLVKPQALMLGFLGLAALILAWIREPDRRKSILKGLGISLAVFAVIVIPFSIGQPLDWLYQLYASTLSSYPYAVLNTVNLFYLLNGNWVKTAEPANLFAPIILLLISCGWGVLWLLRGKSRFRFWWIELSLSGAFAAAFLVFTIIRANWGIVGALSMAFAFMIVLSLYIRKGDLKFLPYCGALLFILLYVLGVKMHERYIFPAVFLLPAAWMIHRDRRILWVTAAISATTLISEGIILDNCIRLGATLGHLNNDTVLLADILSVVNILATLYAAWLGLEICLERSPKEIPVAAALFPVRTVSRVRSPLDYAPDSRLRWSLRDSVILGAIVLVYSVISLTTLGSTKAPQTAWTSSGYDESVILDTGEHEGPVTVLYFAQVSRYDFSVAESDDMQGWSEEHYAEMNQGQCWRWKYVTESWETSDGERRYSNSRMDDVIRFTGRYLRISAHQIGLALNEILVRDEAGQILPVTVVERIGGTPDSELYSDPSLLLDEQDTLEALPSWFPTASEEGGEDIPQPSWWNSTYFDEIYHARTGFEFLHGTSPYETTHPPLGKVLMSFCISVFGMTPFGWRFAGALAGILMLPGMYLFAKQLTGKTLLASFACGFMALDCMHLTQTQIATIDSFPVLFILFAFFFMLRFMQLNILTEKPARVLTNLFLSGLFMGFSIASKWIGVYAGAGLAVLFFWHCLRHIRLCGEAEILAAGQTCSPEEKKKLAPYLKTKSSRQSPGIRKTMILCAWCVLFFVLIPLTIYLLSYVPYFAYDKSIHSFGDYLRAVWRAQEGMFNYHSIKGLGMDHPFYSPWWEWPIIGKPMYYASEQYLPDHGLHYSIFCFGNPVVWFGGLAAVACCLVLHLLGKRYAVEGRNSSVWHLFSDSFDGRYGIVLIGLLAQYLPWMLVPRGTYIYHYFASVPFLILACVLALNAFTEKFEKPGRMLTVLLLALAAVFFIIFFPYASGILAPSSWMDIGKNILSIWY